MPLILLNRDKEEKVSPISLTHVRSLIKELPSPVGSYKSKGTKFNLFLAKKMSDPFWMDPILKSLVIEARKSYFRYGIRAELDQYDPKSAIYLVQVLYDIDGTEVQEWFSCRITPGEGEPDGAGELDTYTLNGKTIDEVMRGALGENKKVFWHHILSSSRMCGIDPFTTVPQGIRNRIELPRRHRFTAECFAIMHAQLLLDNPELAKQYTHITSMIRSELVEKGLGIAHGERTYRPLFVPAYSFLKLSGPKDIQLKREIYAYEFPAYWLDISQLLTLLSKLISEKILSKKDLKHYLGISYDSKFAPPRFGRLLTVNGPIGNSTLTGEELRKLVNTEVEDRPELKITPIRDWNKSMIEMTQAVETDMLKQHPSLIQFGK